MAQAPVTKDLVAEVLPELVRPPLEVSPAREELAAAGERHLKGGGREDRLGERHLTGGDGGSEIGDESGETNSSIGRGRIGPSNWIYR